MKPRLFIGSSSESLRLARALQDELHRDATVTIWNQGVFDLNKSTLDSLLDVIQKTDFAVLVFEPHDLSLVRNQQSTSVRDNVIFELGLFMGSIGRNRAFYLIPEHSESARFPTDLIGVEPGKYDNKREDGNLQAAVAPFCNIIRNKLSDFTIENINDLANESDIIKTIVYEKLEYWEFQFVSALIKDRMKDINASYLELKEDRILIRKHELDMTEFNNWITSSMDDFKTVVGHIKKLLEVDMRTALGDPGTSSNLIEIKSIVDKVKSLCTELLKWEYELRGIKEPKPFNGACSIMKGWTELFINFINDYASEIERKFSPNIKYEFGEVISITISIPSPPRFEELISLIEKVRNEL